MSVRAAACSTLIGKLLLLEASFVGALLLRHHKPQPQQVPQQQQPNCNITHRPPQIKRTEAAHIVKLTQSLKLEQLVHSLATVLYCI